MFEDQRTQELLNQAVGSFRRLVDQRDLHQIALMQWICGKFTLADDFMETGDRVTHELWLCIIDGAGKDIAIEVVHGADGGTVMQANWCDKIISIASHARFGECVRWAHIILAARDRRLAAQV